MNGKLAERMPLHRSRVCYALLGGETRDARRELQRIKNWFWYDVLDALAAFVFFELSWR